MRTIAFAALLVATTAPLTATAGEFAVSPIRLELSGALRTAALTVRNDDTTPLSFQITGMTWTQDDKAVDQYQNATDLIYFPRLLTLEPGREGVIRVGVRPGVWATEKTYRLFVEELASALKPSTGGPQVRVLVRFGAPVFVKPAQPLLDLQVSGIETSAGAVAWTVRNAGNEHELFRDMQVRGFDANAALIFSHQVAARYLLAGSARQFSVPLEPGQCDRIARISVEVATEKSQARGGVSPESAPCR
ncbi:MAG TPA: fimbria/pilus periplasmic chaperone [Burkholderiaceae bacterium]|nr:fimbria/pilus periplasmic chaperone [Burkholderiaceae bacterium]